VSLFSSSRSVLILADEGLQIYDVVRSRTRLVDFVPWDTVEFETSVKDVLVRKCKRKPVVILNDMVEQHYRKERVPKVGIMDNANVLKRRLGVAFPNYKIRAALKLDEKNASLEGRGRPYLFAAIPSSETFLKVMRAVSLSSATVVGLYLLPVEAASMVKELASKLSKGRKSKASWTIFMGQHHNGSVRQIVTRNNDLALTRMSPVVDTDVEPELWAKEMSTELEATMSYLSRFGYKESDGLNVIVIANERAEEDLKRLIQIECNLHVLNVQQAGRLIGTNTGIQNDLRYADALHVAYLGRKSKFRLPMQSATIENVTRPRKVASLVVLGLLAGCAYFGYQAFTSWSKTVKIGDEIRVTEERKRSVKQEYDLELAKKKEIGFDFLLVSNSVDLFDDFEKQKIKPLPVISEIGQSLGADLRLDRLDIEAIQPKEKSKFDLYADNQEEGKKEDKTAKIKAVMILSFDSSVDPDVGVRKVNNLQQSLQLRLPNYDVNVVKQVADLSYTGNFIGETGDANLSDSGDPQNYEAEIVVEGPVR